MLEDEDYTATTSSRRRVSTSTTCRRLREHDVTRSPTSRAEGSAGNLARVIPPGLRAEIDWDAWERPPVFDWLARHVAEESFDASSTSGSGTAPSCASRADDLVIGRIERRDRRSRERRGNEPAGAARRRATGGRRRVERLRRAWPRARRGGRRSGRSRFRSARYPDRDARDAAMADWLGQSRRPARRLRRLHAPPRARRSSSAFRGRVVNVHPAPLPDFPGAHPLEDVLAAGATRGGCDRALRRRGRRHRAGHRKRARARAPRRHGGDAPRARPRGRAPVAAQRWSASCARADLRLRQGRRRRRSRGVSRSSGSSSSRAAARRVRSRSQGVTVTTVEDVTGFPEMLGGRVKTLHPRHPRRASSPARELEEDLAAARRARDRAVRPRVREPLPVRAVAVDRPELDDDDVIEMIDIGGPALLRAAAKNYASVVARLPSAGLRDVLAELWSARGDDVARACDDDSRASRSLEQPRTRRRSPAGSSAARSFPETFTPGLRQARSSSRTARTRTSCRLLRGAGGARRTCSRSWSSSAASALSFNNLNDLSAARLLAAELDGPACVIVKHANPCGVGVAGLDRGGVREGARGRSPLGIRRRRRPQPGGRARARRTLSPRSSSRCSSPRATRRLRWRS